ncbi:hypothetical protein [Cypionkella psychrotolerans]|uniref:hypothetical protein n=1 Tax=Cypionkella psychrotolerans TaxID=1678131 RepID=UPI00138EFF7C|nr:hypothetical protein [Cypionkella psychrotolerans]
MDYRKMGTIVERTRADGSVAFRAQILIKSNSRIVHQESSTFDRRSTAEAWLKSRERELHSPGGLEAVQRKTGSVGDILKDYLIEMGTSMGRTKTQVLRSIRAEYMIAEIPCQDLRSKDIVDFAGTLRRGERDPSTVQNYLSHLSAALSIARTVE